MKSLQKLEIGGGVRPNPGYIQMDAKKIPGIDIIGDVRKLPFKDGELDEVFGHWILEHFYYREITDVLREWLRALKPGGLVHMVTNNGQAHVDSYVSGKISIHELNRMIFGVDLADKTKHTEIEDLHKVFWTEDLVHYFFDPLFSKVEVKSTWKHRDDEGNLKCPGLIIRAYK